MPKVSLPSFRTVSSEEPVAEWRSGSGGELPAAVSPWDQQRSIQGSLHLRVKPYAIFQELGLPDDARLRVALVWHSPGSQLRRVASGCDLPSCESTDISLPFEVPGDLVTTEVRLRGLISVLDAGSDPDALAPRTPGAVVWDVQHTVALGLNMGGFPVAWVRFTDVDHLPDRAAWHVNWDPSDLSVPLEHGVRLLLNSAHDRLVDAIAQPALPESRPVLEFLYFDVGRTLIQGALRQKQFITPGHVFEPGSVGYRLRTLVSALFGSSVQASTLSERAQREPGRFERELQDALVILGALG